MLYFRFAKTRESEESTEHKSFPVPALATHEYELAVGVAVLVRC